jgi:hypothetical protein
VTGSRDLRATAAFLLREFGADKFADADYLHWYYDANPDGPAVCGVRDDEEGRLASYALVPQKWRRGDERALLGITVDACVRTGAQRAGVFRSLAREVFDGALAAGVSGTLTIANANSTPAFVEKLGLEHLGGLPVSAVVPASRIRDVTHVAVDESTIARLATDCAARTTPGWVHDWTVESLRWRLANPIREYTVHHSDDVWCVSVRSGVGPVPAVVVVALVPRDGRRGVAAGSVISAACRHHRAPIAIHAGINRDVRVRGIRLPRRLLPSPLNLLALGFGERPTDSIVDVGVYEFLDTDHY